MLDKESVGQIITDGFNKTYFLATKSILIQRIIDMGIGSVLEWAEVDHEGEVICWHFAEKMSRQDSVIVLLGGYGGDLISCFLPGETCGGISQEDDDNIRKMVDYFFENIRFIGEDEFIYIKSIFIKL